MFSYKEKSMKNRLILAAAAAFLAAAPIANAEAARSVFNTGSDIGMGKHRDLSTDIRPGAQLPDTRLYYDNYYTGNRYERRYESRWDRDEIRADGWPAYIADNGDIVMYDPEFERFYVFNRAHDRYVPREHVVYRHISDRRFKEGEWVLLDTNNDGTVDTRARILYPRSVSSDMRTRARVWEGPYPYIYTP